MALLPCSIGEPLPALFFSYILILVHIGCQKLGELGWWGAVSGSRENRLEKCGYFVGVGGGEQWLGVRVSAKSRFVTKTSTIRSLS